MNQIFARTKIEPIRCQTTSHQRKTMGVVWVGGKISMPQGSGLVAYTQGRRNRRREGKRRKRAGGKGLMYGSRYDQIQRGTKRDELEKLTDRGGGGGQKNCRREGKETVERTRKNQKEKANKEACKPSKRAERGVLVKSRRGEKILMQYVCKKLEFTFCKKKGD